MYWSIYHLLTSTRRCWLLDFLCQFHIQPLILLGNVEYYSYTHILLRCFLGAVSRPSETAKSKSHRSWCVEELLLSSLPLLRWVWEHTLAWSPTTGLPRWRRRWREWSPKIKSIVVWMPSIVIERAVTCACVLFRFLVCYGMGGTIVCNVNNCYPHCFRTFTSANNQKHV